VLDLADVGPVVEQLVEHALVERLPALGVVPGGIQLLHQLRGRADLQEALEDVPDEARLAHIDHQLALPHVIAERRMASHPKSSLAGGKKLGSNPFGSQLSLKLAK
jgi:hypothetical protein